MARFSVSFLTNVAANEISASLEELFKNQANFSRKLFSLSSSFSRISSELALGNQDVLHRVLESILSARESSEEVIGMLNTIRSSAEQIHETLRRNVGFGDASSVYHAYQNARKLLTHTNLLLLAITEINSCRGDVDAGQKTLVQEQLHIVGLLIAKLQIQLSDRG